ncbi:hypothetical protein GC722_12285 [Auraticoccus sp. F435]|uniref:Peptidase n=1 Tax=Auraticoccus cholistanensis TaxID=2656650 RepID=A0A6A9UYE8_9ACTN|nr:hypothetical protein [Auraticoccus cholistanensis]
MTQSPWGQPPRQRPAQQWSNPPAPWGQPQWPAPGPQRGRPPAQWPGQPVWGQPTGGAPGPTFPPPRAPQRPNPLRTLFLAMSALAVVALLGLIAVNVSGVGSSSDVAWANEDYQVPPETSSPPELPAYPTTFEEAYAALEENPLYSQQMPEPVRCELPPGEPAQMSDRELDAYFTEQMACLTRAWQPPTSAAGYVEVRPPVTIYRDQVTSGCGSMEGAEAVNAFYCPADQAVYFSTLMFEYLPDLREPRIAELVMAHEYGHNVQARTNLLLPAHILMANIDDEDAQLEISRRLEVQADCFAGTFFNSTHQSLQLTDQDFAAMEQALFNIGDDQLSGDPDVVGNHGRGASRQLWGERGWETTALSSCNTFTAPSGEVE